MFHTLQCNQNWHHQKVLCGHFKSSMWGLLKNIAQKRFIFMAKA
jgi:hypothetical protein